MKHELLLVLLLIFLSISFTYQGGPNLSNPYKENKKIKHSLFREKDSQDRMSISRSGVPEKIGKTKSSKVKEPEKLVAARIVEYYRKIFDYLDYKPVDDLINPEELSEAFRDFSKIYIYHRLAKGNYRTN
jgi:hypothetical protein